ncbi:bile acid:sodium symporter family protein [Varibaculum massiliense]|uniref:bile acid:sodium symporter family protein n=1 Tax=Varibaculum massiliense TaxID=1852372 RepID=UPI0008DA2911|nr:bile acid:sodium symporter family protein [Varibaculum massiliense]
MSGKQRLRSLLDPFILSILVILVLGILIPVPAVVVSTLGYLGNALIVLLFFLYGARLSTKEIWEGLKNWRLQGAVALSTFVLFPLLGMAMHPVDLKLLGPVFALGTLYLTLLPSTVQSSVTFTSIAGGNIAGAVCSATISNIAGIILTPALVFVVMGRASGFEAYRVVNVLLQLLLPFVLGQLFHRFIGKWLNAHRALTKATDNGTILAIVASSVCGATAGGLWQKISAPQVGLLLLQCMIVLAIMLTLTWNLGRWISLNRRDRIVLLMCGSKKSLATGLPMAAIIFPTATVAAVTIPVIVFHQFQLLVCAVLARRLAMHPE